MLHEDMQLDIITVLNRFDTEQQQDKAFALLLVELRGIVEQSRSALQLKQYIGHRLKKVPYKAFGFLPWVDDIRRSLDKVFLKEDYMPVNLLVEENANIREENWDLKEQIKQLETKIKSYQPDNNREWKLLENKILELEQKIEEQQQKNALISCENKLLKNQLADVSNANEQLKQTIIEAKQKQEKISQLYEGSLREKSMLLTQIEELKQKLLQINPQSASSPSLKSGFQKYFNY